VPKIFKVFFGLYINHLEGNRHATKYR
jgi:hypothetical protein